jgi:hypothetical protein
MSGSEYLLWSYGQFEKMTFFPPDPLVSRQRQHAKPSQTVQDQEETYPRSWSNDAPMGLNWHLASQHAKECPEAATQESFKKQAQQEMARQQAQQRGGC